MTEPGAQAPDRAALLDEARRIGKMVISEIDKVRQSLTPIETYIQLHKGEPTPKAYGRSRRKGNNRPPLLQLDGIKSVAKNARESVDALQGIADRLITALSQASRELPRNEHDSPVAYDALGREWSDPEREEARQSGLPAHAIEAGGDLPRRLSEGDASHGLTQPSAAGRVGERKDAADFSLSRLGSRSLDEQAIPSNPRPQLADTSTNRQDANPDTSSVTNAVTNPRPVNGGGGSGDRDTARDENAAGQGSDGNDTPMREEAEEPALSASPLRHGSASATSTEASGNPSSDGSDEDTPMRDCPGGSEDPAVSASQPRRGSASEQATANNQDGIPATNSTPEAEASGSEDEDVVMGDSEAATAQGEGSARSAAADDQSARSSTPEDDTDGGSIGRGCPPGGDRTDDNRLAATAAAAVAAADRQSAKDRTTQLPTTPNSQNGDAHVNAENRSHDTTPRGSDTTQNTSGATTPDTPLTSPNTSAPVSPAKFSLSEAEMGKGLVQALNKLMSYPDFANEVLVPPPNINLAETREGLEVDSEDCHTSVQFKAGPKGEGYANVVVQKNGPSFDWTEFFSEEREEPTVEEAKEILDRFVDNPPDHPIPYVIGHLQSTPFDEPLNPGPGILEEPDLKDLHSEYHHIGLDGSANRFHQEDGTWEDEADGSHHGLCSYNEVYYGYKLWTIIETHHISKFRNWTQTTLKSDKCVQGLSHQCLLIAPSTLEREGIDFRIVVSKPGKAVVTRPGQQHQIVNYGPCAARSINFLPRGEKLQFRKVVYCDEDGLAKAYAKHGATRLPLPRRPRPGRTPLVSGSHKRPAVTHADLKRRTRACTQESRDLKTEIDAAKEADPLCSIPAINRSNPPPLQAGVFRRAMSIRSKVAVDQLVALTRESAQLCSNLPEPQDPIDKQLIKLRKDTSASALSKFRVRYSQVSLARVVDEERESEGRCYASHTDLKSRAEHYGVKDIHYHLRQGRQWIKICGAHEGFLPLILLSSKTNKFAITSNQWEELNLAINQEMLEEFHGLLDDLFAKDLDAAGKVFLGILDGREKAAEWELALRGAEEAEDLAAALKSYMRLSQIQS